LPPEKGAKLLAGEILSETKREAEKIIEAAETERKTILEAAKLSCKEEEFQALQKARAEGERIREQILAEGRMRARKGTLQKREELINEVFKEVNLALKKYTSSKKYERDLIELAKVACEGIGSQEVRLRTNRKDLKLLEKRTAELSERLGKSISLGEPIEALGGVKAETPDGKVVVDETLDSRFKRIQERLRVEIAKILFQGSK
jgi:V/A-type H+-transporting ATPase subunit E